MPNVYAELRKNGADAGRPFIRQAEKPDISYADLDATTSRLAGALVAEGVTQGDVVAVLVEKSAQALMFYLALSRIGAVFLPVHTGLTLAEIAHILDDARPRLVLSDPAFQDAVERMTGYRPWTLDARGRGTLIDRALGAESMTEAADSPPEAPNALVYTSGTTGRPKGAWISNEQVVWNVRAIRDTWAITADDTLLHLNLMAYGIFATTLPMLAAGASILLVPDASTDQVLAALPRVTMMASVPTVYSRLLDDQRLDAKLCTSMRLFITGSAMMREDLFEAFHRRTGHKLLDRYGMTEALLITSNRADEERVAGNSGYPLPGCELRIRNAEGAAAQGEVGLIEIRQAAPFRSYLNDPQKTREAFSPDGWFMTGDFGKLDEKGRLVVLGRGSDLIITGGLNVYPKEVENALNEIEGVADSAVIGVPHPQYGDAVFGVVELADGYRFSADDARGALRQVLAGYKVPKHIESVVQLPRNALGKVKKSELRSRYVRHFDDSGA